MGNQEIKGSLGQGFGYRIISIAEKSPCAEAGIQFFTEFIIDAFSTSDEQKMKAELPDQSEDYKVEDKKDFFGLVNDNENKQIILVVYNQLSRTIRKLEITPNKLWSEQGNLLGVMLRLENYLAAHNNTFRVVAVGEGSPASKAGLTPMSDYIIGLKKYKYDGLDELINIIFDNEGQDVDLVVYNIQEKQLRSIVLKPQKDWGGKGLIGCEFAGGFLNQLPLIQDNSDNKNGSSHAITDSIAVTKAASAVQVDCEEDNFQHATGHHEENANLAGYNDQQKELKIANPVRNNLSLDPPPKDPIIPTSTTASHNNHTHNQHNASASYVDHLHKRNEQKLLYAHKEHLHNTDPFVVAKRKHSDQVSEQGQVQAQPKQEQQGQQQQYQQQSAPSTQVAAAGINEQKTLTQAPIQQQGQSQSQLSHQSPTPEADGSIILIEKPTEHVSEQTSQQQLQSADIVSRDSSKIQSSSSLSGKRMEFDAPNISEKYVIEEKNLFPVGIKILQPNLLLDETSWNQKVHSGQE